MTEGPMDDLETAPGAPAADAPPSPPAAPDDPAASASPEPSPVPTPDLWPQDHDWDAPTVTQAYALAAEGGPTLVGAAAYAHHVIATEAAHGEAWTDERAMAWLASRGHDVEAVADQAEAALERIAAKLPKVKADLVRRGLHRNPHVVLALARVGARLGEVTHPQTRERS